MFGAQSQVLPSHKINVVGVLLALMPRRRMTTCPPLQKAPPTTPPIGNILCFSLINKIYLEVVVKFFFS